MSRIRPVSARVLVAGLTIAAGASFPLSAALAQASGTRADAPAARPSSDSEVPVRRITLYRSGVGYFERSGTINGNAEIQLRFKTEQINDILKSMILLDLDGGRIDSVSYASKEPLTRRLASFGINIADNPTAVQILERLRGTPVKISTTDGEHSGTIMNVEKRPTVYQGPAGSGTATSVHDLPWINLLTDKGVRSFNLTAVSGFEILDKELAAELNKALGTLAEYRADTSKTVDLRFAGSGSRRVVVGYVQESPVWKTSYRLVLPDKDPPASEGSKGSVVMQGWAIVENTTDQDWNGVQLALVSGRPVSFQMDLYEPLFTFRPMIPVPTIPGVMPRTFAGGVDTGVAEALRSEVSRAVEDSQRRALAGRGRSVALGAPAFKKEAEGASIPAPAAAGIPYADVTGDDMVNYAAQAQAAAAETGEVFQFEVKNPVTVERQRSAMIPIISANITGRRVSIYSQAEGRPNPMRGVEIVNESDLQLLPGPISVFDGAAYAGDAQIGHIARGDKRLLEYSVDLDVNVITTPREDSSVTRLKIVDGLIIQTISTTSTVSYAFDVKDTKRGRTLIIEQPRLPGWTLVEPGKPKEETQSLYRFEVAADAGKTTTMSVVQQRTEQQSVAVTSLDMPTIVAFHKNGRLSDGVLRALQEVARKQSEINQAERDIAELDRQRSEIDAEQSRIRENMGRIDRASQLYTRYMTKLSDQETTLEDLRDRRKAAQLRLDGLRTAFNEFLRTLNVD